MKNIKLFLVLALITTLSACDGGSGGNNLNSDPNSLIPPSNVAPVLDNLVISDSDSTSITLQQPTLSTVGDPLPTVEAYIGVNGVITVNGPAVSNYVEGPVDVSSGGYQFSGLNINTDYKIIVIAQNSEGYSVKQITQSTGPTAPILNNLVVPNSDSSSITLQQPTFSTSGNPAPTVNAYIGINGVITASGSTVNNYIQGPVDVSTSGYLFTGLNPYTDYKIIVVAENYIGYSVKQIVQSTDGIAPVLNNIVISNFDSSSITLQQPTLSVAGNPVPAVQAYIGVSGVITISGSTVSNYIQGPVDVSTGGHQFTSLNSYTNYKIIVVAENNQGYSVKQIIQSTDGVAPVLNNLVVPSYDSSSVTLQHPTFSISGNPTPTVNAYIGLNGVIAVVGSTVSNYVQGPVDVSLGDHQFSGLSANTNYRIIVVANNVEGSSVKQVTQTTLPTPGPSGDIDVSFGVNGVLSGLSGNGCLAIQPDGKIIASTYVLGVTRLRRYNTNGSVDTSFGTGGSVQVTLSSAFKCILQPDGKIVVGGEVNSQYGMVFAVSRYSSSGVVDCSFHSSNTSCGVLTTIGSEESGNWDLAIQGDGKIVTVGYAGAPLNQKIALARYNTDGSSDVSFGVGGTVVTPIANSNAAAVIIQPDQKILVVGAVPNVPGLIRYNSNGSLDSSFGTNGIAEGVGFYGSARGVTLQPDGKIIVVGYPFYVSRFNANGSLDSSFGTNGVTTGTVPGSYGESVLLQSSGKIVVAGYYGLNGLELAQYNINGTLDTNFGNAGHFSFVSSGFGQIKTVVKGQPDGKIVVSGGALIRLWP